MRYFYQYLSVILLLFPAFCSAQKNFKDGYVVTLKGDTLKGVIDYREWDNNPTEIHFKSNSTTDNLQTFNLDNAKAFGIYNQEFYQRTNILVSVNSINIDDAIFNKDTAKLSRTVFLKILIKGNKVNLYAYADKIKTRYYYTEKSKKPIEFEYSIYNTENGETHYKRQYRAQLTYLALKLNPDNQGIASLIEKADYAENDFVDIISKINGSKIILAKNGFSTFFVGTGLTYSKLTFLGSGLADPSTTDKQLPMPFVNVGFIHYMNKDTRKLFFSFELGLLTGRHELHSEHKTSNGTSTISDAYADLKFSQYTAKINPHIGYNFYSTPNLKVFGMLGLSLNFAAYSKHDYIEYYTASSTSYIAHNYPGFANFFIEPDARVGITIGQKIDIFAGYFRGAIYDGLDNNVKYKAVQAGIQYHFKK